MLDLDTEVLLIKVVQQQPAIYDRADPHFKDHNGRNNIWKNITRVINKTLPADKRITSQQCKECWFMMRNRYSSAIRRRRNKPQLNSLKWIHEDRMAFLNPHLSWKNREDGDNTNNEQYNEPTDINTADSNDDGNNFLTESLDSLDGNHIDETTKEDRIYERNEAERVKIRTHIDKKGVSIVTWNSNATPFTKFDDMDLFFLGMAKDIKELPVTIRAQLRVDIAEALRDAELSAESGRAGLV